MATSDRLTAAELARRADLSPERVDELVSLGILQPRDGTFAPGDVMRARAVARLEGLGIEAATVGEALRSGFLSLGYLESAVRRHPRSERTFREVAEEIGVTFEALERVFVAYGLPRPEPDEPVREEDLEALRALPVLFGAGLEEPEVLPMARVWGDAMRRVAEYLTHYFHTTIEERYRARGMADNAAYEAAVREVGLRLGRSGEDLLGWLYRRHSEVFQVEHQLEHAQTALEEAGLRPRPPREAEATVFADLTGYSRSTDQAGDRAAARMSVTLAQLVNEVAAANRGSVVKLLGDGVHFHFRDPADAVRAALAMVEQAPARGLPPAHVGADAGPMLYEEGDYFGRTVIIAARIAALAGPGQVLVGRGLAERVTPDAFRLVEAGDRELKGIAGRQRVFEAVPHPS